MRNNVLNSPRLLELKRKRQKVFLNKFLFFLFALAIICIALSFIFRLNRLNIAAISVTGNKIVDTEMIKEKVATELAGNYLWIFPKTNIFFYPKNKIKNNLAIDFKRLENISFNISEERVLEISVSEREALYTWCGNIFNNEGNQISEKTREEKCYFVDKNGYIFDEAPYFSGEVYFKFYGYSELGSYFSSQNFNKLISFKKTLEDMGLKPVMLYAQGNGDVKIFLSTLDASFSNPEIIFKADSDLKIIAENLDTALATEPLLTDFKKKYSSLLYIDLRYGNKVYYKFK